MVLLSNKYPPHTQIHAPTLTCMQAHTHANTHIHICTYKPHLIHPLLPFVWIYSISHVTEECYEGKLQWNTWTILHLRDSEEEWSNPKLRGRSFLYDPKCNKILCISFYPVCNFLNSSWLHILYWKAFYKHFYLTSAKSGGGGWDQFALKLFIHQWWFLCNSERSIPLTSKIHRLTATD